MLWKGVDKMLSNDEIKRLKELTSKLSLKELKGLIKTNKEYNFMLRNNKIITNNNLINLLQTIVSEEQEIFSVELMKKINSKLENVSNYNVSMLLFQCQSEIFKTYYM